MVAVCQQVLVVASRNRTLVGEEVFAKGKETITRQNGWVTFSGLLLR